MAAGLLGLAAGGLLGYAGQQHARKQALEAQTQQEASQMRHDYYEKNPWAALRPDADKENIKLWGKEATQSMKPIWQAMAASAQRDTQLQVDELQKHIPLLQTLAPAMGPSGQTLLLAAQDQLAKAQAKLSEIKGEKLSTPMSGMSAPASGITPPGQPGGGPQFASPASGSLQSASGGGSVPPAQATPNAAPVVPGGIPGPPAVPGPAPAPGGAASAQGQGAMSPADMLANLQTLRMNIGSLGLDKDQEKDFTSGLDMQIKHLEKLTEPKKASPNQEAVSSAYFGGRSFYSLSEDEQKRAIQLSQQIGEGPQIDAYNRAQTAWDKHNETLQAERAKVDAEKTRKGQLNFASSTRAGVVALNQKLGAQMKLYNVTAKTQEEKQAYLDQMNADVDMFKQRVMGDMAEGRLPDNFSLRLPQYSLDPATGNFKSKYFSWAGGQETPGMIKPSGTTDVGGATSAAPITPFKAGDRRTKDGKVYERNEKGEWYPVNP